MPVIIIFWSSVNLISLSPYFSLIFERSCRSSAVSLPTGMWIPAQYLPSCFWGWIPKNDLGSLIKSEPGSSCNSPYFSFTNSLNLVIPTLFK